jgi:hypothetical protein
MSRCGRRLSRRRPRGARNEGISLGRVGTVRRQGRLDDGVQADHDAVHGHASLHSVMSGRAHIQLPDSDQRNHIPPDKGVKVTFQGLEARVLQFTSTVPDHAPCIGVPDRPARQQRQQSRPVPREAGSVGGVLAIGVECGDDRAASGRACWTSSRCA